MGLKLLYVLKSIEGAPEEFQLFPYGKIGIEGEDDAFVDDESMDAIIADFERRGNDMVIDYEHQTLQGVKAPAAGWIKRFINRGKEGFWVVVEWTRQAKEYLENREYRYFSPVFWVSENGRKIIKIENVALTNFPKLNNLRPIMAKMSLEEAREAREARSRKYRIGIKEGGHVTKPSEWEHVPDDEWLDPVNYRYPCPDAAQTRAAAGYWGQEDNQAQYNPEERSIINGRLDKFRKKFNIGEFRKEANMLDKLKKLLGLADDAGEDKVVEAAEAVVAKNKDMIELFELADDAGQDKVAEAAKAVVAENKNLKKQVEGKKIEVVAKEVIEALGLKEDAAREDVITTIRGLKASHAATDDLSGQVAKLSADIAAIKKEDLVGQAVLEGKITKDQLEKWGNDMALNDPEQFKKVVLSKAVGSEVPVDKLAKKEIKADDAILDQVQLSINKMVGVSEDSWKKYGPKNTVQ